MVKIGTFFDYLLLFSGIILSFMWVKSGLFPDVENFSEGAALWG